MIKSPIAQKRHPDRNKPYVLLIEGDGYIIAAELHATFESARKSLRDYVVEQLTERGFAVPDDPTREYFDGTEEESYTITELEDKRS